MSRDARSRARTPPRRRRRRTPSPRPGTDRGSTACPFCREVRAPPKDSGLVVADGRLLRATHELEEGRATYRGVVRLVLRRHSEWGLADLTDSEGAELGRAVARIGRAMRAVLGAPWAYAYGFTEGFRHAHLFVVARYPELPNRSVRLGVLDWRGAPRSDPDGIRALVRDLRSAMATAGGS